MIDIHLQEAGILEEDNESIKDQEEKEQGKLERLARNNIEYT